MYQFCLIQTRFFFLCNKKKSHFFVSTILSGEYSSGFFSSRFIANHGQIEFSFWIFVQKRCVFIRSITTIIIYVVFGVLSWQFHLQSFKWNIYVRTGTNCIIVWNRTRFERVFDIFKTLFGRYYFSPIHDRDFVALRFSFYDRVCVLKRIAFRIIGTELCFRL